MVERFEVDGIWLDGVAHGPTVVELADGRLQPAVAPAYEPALEQPGELSAGSAQLLARRRVTLMPGVIDHHVHLGLVDRELLADGPLVEVHDLGWDPAAVLAWRARPPHGVTVKVAGPFHTAVGGYPSGRPWAPRHAVRAVIDAADARLAVATAAEDRVDAIKIALNSDMPLLSDALLETLVQAAHAVGLPAIVHAEGVGQAARAIDAGADTLVHTPWSEPLSDDVLQRALGTTWISTLAIHEGADREIAIENLGRFHQIGGRIRYGTDMGNGPNPVGPNPQELRLLAQAGLSIDQLIAAMTSPVGPEGVHADRVLASPRALPRTCEELIEWLADCRRLVPAGSQL